MSSEPNNPVITSVNFEAVNQALNPPLRYLIATHISANLVLFPIIYFSLLKENYQDQFWLLLFLINILLVPAMTAFFLVALAVHRIYAKIVTKKINQALASGQKLPLVTVQPYTLLAKLGLTAVRSAVDDNGNKLSVICFQKTDATFKAILWQVPTLISTLTLKRKLFVAIPI